VQYRQSQSDVDFILIDDKLQTLGIVFSIVATALVVAHMTSDKFVIDNTTVFLLVIGAFPWLLPYIKTLKVTGLGEIEFKQAMEEVKSRLDETAETLAATQSALISGVGKNPSSNDMKGSALPLAEDQESILNGDPHRGKFGGSAERDGYRLTGVVRGLKGNSELFEVIVWVEGVSSNKLADGQKVQFYLHPTFRPATSSVSAKEGKATLKRYSWGAFTVGAIVQKSKTNLELDLAQLPDAPAIFKSR
jgi:hypothetical protein